MKTIDWIYNNSRLIIFECLVIGIGILLLYFGGYL